MIIVNILNALLAVLYGIIIVPVYRRAVGAMAQRLGQKGRAASVIAYGLLAAAHLPLIYKILYPYSLSWRYKFHPVWDWVCCLVVVVSLVGWVVDFFYQRRRIERVAREPEMPERRVVIRKGVSMAVAGAGLGLGIYGFSESRDWMVRTVKLFPEKWPSLMRGFSIVQLTDLHAGPFFGMDKVRKLVSFVNNMQPDIVVLTGDLIDDDPKLAPPMAEEFRKISTKFGIYAVMGNHAYIVGLDAVKKPLERAGIPVLYNNLTQIMTPGGPFNLCGVDDGWGKLYGGPGPDIDKALRGRIKDRVTILLAHQPSIFPQAVERKIDLTLSGHTHGGQIAIGRTLNPARIMGPYVQGLYKEGDSRLYVSNGLGTIGVPMRLGVPPEITRIIFT